MKNTALNRTSFLLILILLFFIFTGAMCAKKDEKNIVMEQEVVNGEAEDVYVYDIDSEEEKTYDYRNDTYGFTLQVPQKFVFSEDSTTTSGFAVFERPNEDPSAKPDSNFQIKPDSGRVVLSFYEIPEGEFAEDYIKEEIIGPDINIKTRDLRTQGNLIIYRYQYVNNIGPAIDFLIEYPDGRILQVAGYYGKGGKQEKIMEQIYEIQDSFREI